jgi:hypothetical protein
MQSEKFYNLLYNHQFLNNETALELKLLTEKYPWFQMGWVLYCKNLKQIASPEYQSVLKKVAVRVSDRKLLFNYLNSDFPKKTEKAEFENSFSVFEGLESEVENTEGNSLIDRFLLSKPGAIRRNSDDENKADNENRINIVEKSITENDEFITETLADIYLQQKNYEKAMDAYKKLSLKYPEKSIYFATQIEEIIKLKNTNSY